MTPDKIRKLRNSLGENTAAFAARFSRSARTVEDWEQGRRNPDPLAVAEMARIAAKIGRKKSRKNPI
jgi:putative transcriptional regulator